MGGYHVRENGGNKTMQQNSQTQCPQYTVCACVKKGVGKSRLHTTACCCRFCELLRVHFGIPFTFSWIEQPHVKLLFCIQRQY